MCHCKICNKEFRYGDQWSPMFSEEIWKRLIDHYGLAEYEKEAEKKFDYWYEKWVKAGEGEKYHNEADADECHTYICYECAEKALGRKIVPEDLIGEDTSFNALFEMVYFGKDIDLDFDSED